MFSISRFEFLVIPTKQRKQIFLSHMLYEGPSNIQCYIVQKKRTILEEKIKRRITTKSRAKNNENIWIQNKVNLNRDFCSN